MKTFFFALFFVLTFRGYSQSPEEKLMHLKIELPPVSEALGSYVDAVSVGNLLLLSGKGWEKNSQ